MRILALAAMLFLASCVSVPPQTITLKDGIYYHPDRRYQFILPTDYQLVDPALQGTLGTMAFAVHHSNGFLSYNKNRASMLLFAPDTLVNKEQFEKYLNGIYHNQDRLNSYMTSTLNEIAGEEIAQILDVELLHLKEFSVMRGHAKGLGGETFVIWGFRLSNSEVNAGKLALETFLIIAPPSEKKTAESDFNQFLEGLNIHPDH